MSIAMMSAPSAARRTAWLRPWARAAPVMNATLPSSSPMSAPHQREAIGRRARVVGELHLVSLSDAEVGDGGQQFLERDADLEPGEVRPETTVKATGERDVRVRLAVEVDREGIGER